MRKAKQRPRAVIVTAAMLAVMTVGTSGCSSGDDDDDVEPLGGAPSESVTASATPTSSPPETTPVEGVGDLRFTRVMSETSTGDSAVDGALLAYIGYTEMSGRLFADPTADTEDVGLYASGRALDQAVDLAAQLAEDEQNLQGAVTIRPEVAGQPSEQLVLIEDCMDQSEVRLHHADGDPDDIDQADWLDIHAEVQRTSGHGWRVTTYQLDGRSRPCE